MDSTLATVMATWVSLARSLYEQAAQQKAESWGDMKRKTVHEILKTQPGSESQHLHPLIDIIHTAMQSNVILPVNV